MMPISQKQDPQGSFKVNYPTTRISTNWSQVLISTKRAILPSVFTAANGACYSDTLPDFMRALQI